MVRGGRGEKVEKIEGVTVRGGGGEEMEGC